MLPCQIVIIFLAAGHGKLKYLFFNLNKKTIVLKNYYFFSPDTKSTTQVKKLNKNELKDHQEKLKHYGWVNILIIIFLFQLINIFYVFLAVSWRHPRRLMKQPVVTVMSISVSCNW